MFNSECFSYPDMPDLASPNMANILSDIYNIRIIASRVIIDDATAPVLIVNEEAPYATMTDIVDRYQYRVGLAWLNTLRDKPFYKLISRFDKIEQAYSELANTTFRVHIYDEEGEDGGMIEFPRMFCLFAPKDTGIIKEED